MVNVGEVMVPLVGANLQLEISTFFTIYSAAGPGLPLLGHHHQNFPWNPQFLAEFKNFTFFPTQLEKLERLVLVPSRSETKNFFLIYKKTRFCRSSCPGGPPPGVLSPPYVVDAIFKIQTFFEINGRDQNESS